MKRLIKKIANLSNRQLVVLLLALVPIIYMTVAIDKCRVDVPFGDQWDFVPLLEKSYNGTVTFADLVAQHNEHRLFFPRIIMLALAHLTSWRISAEIYMIFFLALAMFAVISLQIRNTLRHSKTHHLIWAIPFVSLLVFSFNQWENWLWGWQIQILLSVFSVVLGIVLLSSPRSSRWKLFTSIILGIIALYSFANGVIYWIIGLGVLLIKPSGHYIRKNSKPFALACWSISGLVVVLSFVWSYTSPANHPSMWSFLRHPVDFILYVFKYIGSSLVGPGGAFLVGAGGISLFVLLVGVYSFSRLDIHVILPYIAIALYSLGSAALSGIGRVGFGSGQAMSPRYTTFSNLFWVALIILLFIMMEHIMAGAIKAMPGSLLNFSRIAIHVILLLIIALTVRNSFIGTFHAIKWKDYLTEARNELLKDDQQDDQMLKRLYPPGAYRVKEQAPVLKKLKTSLYR